MFSNNDYTIGDATRDVSITEQSTEALNLAPGTMAPNNGIKVTNAGVTTN